MGHKSVNFVMADLRSEFWIPKLRTVLKRINRKCESCKVLMATLPLTRTTTRYSFAVTGIDFVGPFIVKEKGEDLKAYMIVFSCATSRGVHFATTRTIETAEFIGRLSNFIGVHTRPQVIMSDNTKTFKTAADWNSQLMKSEALHDHLAANGMK